MSSDITDRQTPRFQIPAHHKAETRIVPISKSAPVPPFLMFGREGKSAHNIKGINLAGLAKTLSPSASWFFWTLVELRDLETNTVRPEDLRSLSATESRRIPRAYKELSGLDLVQRVSKQTYLINPKAVIPKTLNYERIWEKWSDHKRKAETTPGFLFR